MSTTAETQRLRRRPSRAIPAIIVSVIMILAGAGLAWMSIAKLVNGSWPVFLREPRNWLAELSWADPVGWAIGGAAALLGLVLILAALIPGQPNTVRVTHREPADGGSDVASDGSTNGAEDFVLTRKAIARLAATQADQIDGVSAVSASASTSRVQLSISTPLYETRALHEQVVSEVSRRLSEVGLDPVPRVTATIRSKAAS
ncbi:DUF6286 domain-containing protein [Saxibacter everestensis]|uniref:DUF6286 domain-containing protein n=1 Tax=Saxibacter everestensis TaxID=2909229 RepID=A0ABY8QU13_9MICO|nr:DUF6286 domain-containing protein [Brevibacteriaceae bacterium ZFBP1038]